MDWHNTRDPRTLADQRNPGVRAGYNVVQLHSMGFADCQRDTTNPKAESVFDSLLLRTLPCHSPEGFVFTCASPSCSPFALLTVPHVPIAVPECMKKIEPPTWSY
jgi:hypothetical protein